ncbi:MAG TPA: hypothetical protein VNV61_07985 [Steroidobacteraceae bacterium]|jgi:hypothetical protein|nr:hypothetical protein [Steroidobacteraceae bacterium]
MKVFILWSLMLPNPHAPESEGPICSGDPATATIDQLTHTFCRDEHREFVGVFATLLSCATKIQKLQAIDEAAVKQFAYLHHEHGWLAPSYSCKEVTPE